MRGVKPAGGATVVDKRELENIIEAVLKEVFGAAQIGDVLVVRTLDADGDDILRVYVTSTEPKSNSTLRLRSGVVRHMRPRLVDELEVDAFPIISVSTVLNADLKTVKNAVG